MNEYMAKNALVGAGLSLIKKGELDWNTAFGYADLETKTKVLSNETLFRWASMSK